MGRAVAQDPPAQFRRRCQLAVVVLLVLFLLLAVLLSLQEDPQLVPAFLR